MRCLFLPHASVLSSGGAAAAGAGGPVLLARLGVRRGPRVKRLAEPCVGSAGCTLSCVPCNLSSFVLTVLLWCFSPQNGAPLSAHRDRAANGCCDKGAQAPAPFPAKGGRRRGALPAEAVASRERARSIHHPSPQRGPGGGARRGRCARRGKLRPVGPGALRLWQRVPPGALPGPCEGAPGPGCAAGGDPQLECCLGGGRPGGGGESALLHAKEVRSAESLSRKVGSEG